jgi:threonine dehydratase
MSRNIRPVANANSTTPPATATPRAIHGRRIVHPYDDPRIVAGQGTVALEMLDAAPELDTLVVPVGGGGLIGGIATAARARRPSIRIIGVESEGYAAMRQLLRGLPVEVGGATIAEGIAVRDIGVLPLSIARALVDDVVLVSERDIERGVAVLADIEKTVAEGSGAAGIAAMLAHRELFRGRKVGTVICGGNIDPRLLAQILLRDLARSGRMVRLKVVLSEVPGALAQVAGIVGKAGGNIVQVQHQRVYGAISAKSAELELELETRDAAHMAEITAALAAAGFPAQALDGGESR